MDNSSSTGMPPAAHPGQHKRFNRALRWSVYLCFLVLGAFLSDIYHIRHALLGAITGPSGEMVKSASCALGGFIWDYACFWGALLGTLCVAGAIFLAFLLQFLWMFKRSWTGVLATLALILLGLYLYGGTELLKPEHLREKGGWHFVVRGIVRFDNALSAFFPSRASYSEIAPDGPAKSSTPPPAATAGQGTAAARADSLPVCPDFPPGGVCAPPPAVGNLVLYRYLTWPGAGIVGIYRKDFPSVPVTEPGHGTAASPADAIPRTGSRPADADKAPSPEPRMSTVFKYYFFHLLCYAYSIALVSTFFARRLANAFIMIGLAFAEAFLLGPVFRRKRPIRVFWGDGDEAFTAATLNLAPGFRNVFIVPHKVPFALRHKPDAVTDRLNAHDSLRWTYASPAAPGWFMSWFLARASEHYFLGENGSRNVIHANELLTFLMGYSSRFACRNPVFHVRIDAESEEDSFFRWADRWNRYSGRTAGARPWRPAIRAVREPTLVAANFLWNHPMHAVPGVSSAPDGPPSGTINLLLVGYGAHGKALLRDMIQDAQLPGVSLRVAVVDRDARAFTTLRTTASVARDEYRIECHSINAFSELFWSLLPESGMKVYRGTEPPPLWNRIVLAMENDLDNIRLALRIEQHYRQRGLFGKIGKDGAKATDVIFARVRGMGNKDYLDALKNCNGGKNKEPLLPVSTFGNLKEIYAPSSFLDSSTENAAKFLNWIYWENDPSTYPLANMPPGAETAWQNSTSFDRESSRAAVFGLRNLAWLLGHAPEDRRPGVAASRTAPPLSEAVEALRVNQALEGVLAETEHRRWNAFHLFRGIRKWEYTTDELADAARRLADGFRAAGKEPGKDDGVKENQISARRLHAALVRFGELESVAADFNNANREAGLPRRSRITHADHEFVTWMPHILSKTDWVFHGER